MTPREAEILANMIEADKERPWLRPMDFGGKDGSGHSVIATRMAEKGWVDRKGSPGRERITWTYRINGRGRQALANHLALKEAAR